MASTTHDGLSLEPWVKDVGRAIRALVRGFFWLLGAGVTFVVLAVIVGLFLRIVLSVAL